LIVDAELPLARDDLLDTDGDFHLSRPVGDLQGQASLATWLPASSTPDLKVGRLIGTAEGRAN
jgi:hypothetical protein